MVKRAAQQGLSLIHHQLDAAVVKVYLDGEPVGQTRERFTPNLTFDAWYHGQLIGTAETVEQAAQLLVNHHNA